MRSEVDPALFKIQVLNQKFAGDLEGKMSKV